MTDYIKVGKEKINTLTPDSVVNLHQLLSENAHLLEEMDPVEPKGIKSVSMLESAISRQKTGFGDIYKYDNAFSNCATLVYGIIKNHSFHNGNKRTGLLALIKHLYINGYVLNPSLSSDELYDFLVAIADSKLKEFSLKKKRKYTFIRSKTEKRENPEWDTDTNVKYMALWIKRNAKPKRKTFKGEIKISDLKKCLNDKDIMLVQNGSKLEIFIEKENKFLGLFPIGTKKSNIKRYSLGNNRSSINKQILDKIRKDFNLTKSDGIDETFFYNEDSLLDFEIKTYKKLIYRLSKT
ncbi:MAG: type II toxin-antitoxin system death-on-curing family toxin [Tenacibaculum sp.]|nr:type II toxin-antitoxin system death-on-curing family toxin [Tenacibaculum sp.]